MGAALPDTTQGRGENARDSFLGSGNTKARDEVQILGAPSVIDYTTQGETAPGLIRNAIQVLYGTRDDYAKTRDPRPLIDGFAATDRLLRAALAKLEAK